MSGMLRWWNAWQQAGLYATLLGAVLTPPLAAQELPQAASADVVRVIGFVDRPGDCDPLVARDGGCVERVELLDLGIAWDSSRQLNRQDRLLLGGVAHQYAELWEDMAYRREQPSLEGVFSGPMPALKDTWEASARERWYVFSLPDPQVFLAPGAWMGPGGSFPAVRYREPELQHPAPRVVLLAGRFAERLAYDGRPHDYDLMDADPLSSGPFFEQFFPYERSSLEPLAEFTFPTTDLLSAVLETERIVAEQEAWGALMFPGGDGPRQMGALASVEFDAFYRLISDAVTRFAVQDYTATHTRLLAGLVAMRHPPTAVGSAAQRAGLVAASEGQTDPESMVEEELGEGALTLPADFRLDVSALPGALVDDWLVSFPEWRAASPDFVARLSAAVNDALEPYLKDGAKPLYDIEPAWIDVWIEENAQPGRALEVAEWIPRVALRLLLDEQSEFERDTKQTRILVDHFEADFIDRLDPAAFSSPAAVEALAAGRWESVLSRHGFSLSPMDEGAGAVDPLAICTTRDRTEALGEPTFGAVNLDLLFAAPDGLEAPSDILWAARGQLPFLMVDDPSRTPAKVSRLVGLPGGEALYRARWRVWSGWHLLWRPAPMDGHGERDQRLVLQTGAICEDTVLAPSELVPTLLRASLLDGELFPTDPPLQGERWRKTREPTTTDVLLEEIGDAGSSAADAGGAVMDDVGAVREDRGATLDIGGKRLDELAASGGQGATADIEEGSPSVQYLRRVLRAPLAELAGAGDGLVVVALDLDEEGARQRLREGRPRTPYARSRSGGRPVAGWALYLPEEDTGARLVSPSYRPTDSVGSEADMPRWRRNRTAELTLVGGVGLTPWSLVESERNGEAEGADNASVIARADGEEADPIRSDGFALDFAPMVTWWIVGDRRLALEFGPELRLDVRRPGDPLLWDGYGDDSLSHVWAFQPRGGLLIGARGAPDPVPLVASWPFKSPWGAERPGGGSVRVRYQHGLRTGLLIGPGYNGMEWIWATEGWAAWSVSRRELSDPAALAYRPALILGPTVRYQRSDLLSEGEARYLQLTVGHAVIIGVRGQIRLTQ